MIKLWMLSMLFSASVLAQWPSAYAYLGNPIYEDAMGYEALVKHEAFASERTKLEAFIAKTTAAFRSGMLLQHSSSAAQRINYLNELRQLQRENAALHRCLHVRLQALKYEGRLALLHDLSKNASPFIKSSEPVRTAGVLLQGISAPQTPSQHAAMQQVQTQSLWSSYELYKISLFKARERGEADRCLNDVTALYHYVIKLEQASQKEDWCSAQLYYQQANSYRDSASAQCQEQPNILQNVAADMAVFQTTAYDQLCDR